MCTGYAYNAYVRYFCVSHTHNARPDRETDGPKTRQIAGVRSGSTHMHKQRCATPFSSTTFPAGTLTSTSTTAMLTPQFGVLQPSPTNTTRVRVTHPNYVPTTLLEKETTRYGEDTADWRSHDVQWGAAHSYVRKCPACLEEEIEGVIGDVDYLEGLGRGVDGGRRGVRRWRIFAGMELAPSDGAMGGVESNGGTEEEAGGGDNGVDRNGVEAGNVADGAGDEEEEDDGVDDEVRRQVLIIDNDLMDLDDALSPNSNGQEATSEEEGGILTTFERGLLEETRRAIRELERRRRRDDSGSDDVTPATANGSSAQASNRSIVVVRNFGDGDQPIGDMASGMTPEQAEEILERARVVVARLDERDAAARSAADNANGRLGDYAVERRDSPMNRDLVVDDTTMSGAVQREPTPSPPQRPVSRERIRPRRLQPVQPFRPGHLTLNPPSLGPRVLARQARNRNIMVQAREAEERILAQDGQGGLTPDQRGLLFSGQPILATIPEELRENVVRTLGELERQGGRWEPIVGDSNGTRMWIDGAADEEVDWAGAAEGSSPGPRRAAGRTSAFEEMLPRPRRVPGGPLIGNLSTGFLSIPEPGPPNVDAVDQPTSRWSESSSDSTPTTENGNTSPPRQDTPGNLYRFSTYRRPGDNREAWEVNHPVQSSPNRIGTTTSALAGLTLGPNDCPCHIPREWATASNTPTHDGITNHRATLAVQRDSSAHRSARLPRQVKQEELSGDTWEVAVHFEGCGHKLAVFVEKLAYADAANVTSKCGCYGFDRCLVSQRKAVSRQKCLVCRMERDREVWVGKEPGRSGEDRMPWFGRWVRLLESTREWHLWPFGAKCVEGAGDSGGVHFR
ncbi:uncharacterized protein AB675_8433 [Cyphellophora attinorum]|uniref:Uncharacterized protein n=1 Tax=Cyphellophora attinorum TaxID=1664694 RepID=A0A0N1P1W2_9EURO|nr:uncharacterized protein AB675_8433 [Phialophora attinorum]KPI44252.1 hypothetical protein AB675_8433 [Phialophora attinorum]